MEEMMMMGMIGGFMVPVLIASWFVLPFIVYIVARRRNWREGLPIDPQLGLKTVLGFFTFSAYQALLGGTFLLIYSLMQKGDSGNAIRAAFGLIVPSGLVFAAHIFALQRTNFQQLPMITRAYSGLNLLITGSIAFVALVLAFQALFSKGDSGEMGKMAWSMVLVYCGAWAYVGLRFVQGSTTGAPPPGVQQFAQRPGPPPGQPQGGPPPGTY